MEKNITIRPERVSDYQQVEDIIRQAFYNLYTPGCTEHYLAHAIRPHPDFLPELDLVLELDGRVVGNIMYTKSTLVDEAGKEKGILTDAEIAEIEESVNKEIAEACKFAEESPYPEESEAFTDVFVD